MGTYAYDATNDTLDLIAGRGNTDALAAKLSKTSDNIAPKQETNTASELIPVGKYFINANGDLCQCDVQIASGGTIITGTNCHVIPDGGVNELNSKYLQYHKDYYQQPSASDIIEDIVNTLLPIGAPASKSFMWSGLNNNVAYYECVGQCGLNAVSGLYFDQAQAVFFYYYNSTRVVYHAITF